MIKAMTRVQFIGMLAELTSTIDLLQRTGLVELEDAARQPEFGLAPYMPGEADEKQKVELEAALLSADALLDRFQSARGKKETLSPAEAFPDPATAQTRLDEINAQVQALLGERTANRDALTLLSHYRDVVKSLSRQLPPAATDPAYRVFAGLMRPNSSVEQAVLEAKLKELPRADQIKALRIPINPGLTAFAVVYPHERQAQIDALLQAGSPFEMALPEEFSPRQPEEALRQITAAVGANKSALAEIDARMRALADRWTLTLKAVRAAFLNKIEAVEAMTLAGVTDDTFHLIGWCAQEDIARLEQEISDAFHGLVSVLRVEIPASQAGRIPVATSSSEFLQPYKEIVDVRSVPGYSDIDPSGLMAFFMPLFFGFMVSDIGYGILIFIFSWVTRKVKISGLIGNLLKTFRIGALWAIAFGVAFGEFFGNLGTMLGMRPILFSREDPSKTTLLMGIAIGIGVIQVMFGLLIGAWNGLRHHEMKHMLEKAGTFVALVGVLLLGGGLAGVLLPLFTTIGGALIALGLVAVASTMGLTGIFLAPIEFVGVLGSILSYLRLAALGLASVFLAEVANDLAGKLGGIVVGVTAAVVIHAINLVMGMFSPTIQSMRLQFVEFFRRFYTGGGRPFKPFKVHELN